LYPDVDHLLRKTKLKAIFALLHTGVQRTLNPPLILPESFQNDIGDVHICLINQRCIYL